MEQLVFLTYVSRSGSTLLARMLDEYAEVGVSLEARLPDGILYPAVPLRCPADAPPAMEVLYSDPKFRQWGIDREALRTALEQGPFPIRYDRLLRTVLATYFDGDPPQIVICKFGYYVEHVERVRAEIPGARFIFVMRDPRAVYNSQRRSLNSETGTPMSTNPLRVARRFVELERVVQACRDEPWFHLLRYEDLLQATEAELQRLVTFLGLRSTAKAGGPSYDERIPAAERHLHERVGGRAQQERIDAWSRELSTAEILTIERAAADAMARHGYDTVVGDAASGGDRLRTVGYRLRYGAWRLARKAWRAVLTVWPGGGHYRKRALGVRPEPAPSGNRPPRLDGHEASGGNR